MTIFVAAIGLLILLIYFKNRGYFPGVLVTKPLLSLLFIIVACWQPTVFPVYALLLTGALSLCWIGDVCLIFSAKGMFLAGLIVFLFAHLLYAAACLHLSGLNGWSAAGAMVAIPLAVWVYRWLRPHLGTMKSPVLLYMAVISVMLVAAVSLGGDRHYDLGGRMLVSAGALAFYLSDIFVVRQHFVISGFSNHLLGLPLYYLAQFLLAFSISGLAAH